MNAHGPAPMQLVRCAGGPAVPALRHGWRVWRIRRRAVRRTAGRRRGRARADDVACHAPLPGRWPPHALQHVWRHGPPRGGLPLRRRGVLKVPELFTECGEVASWRQSAWDVCGGRVVGLRCGRQAGDTRLGEWERYVYVQAEVRAGFSVCSGSAFVSRCAPHPGRFPKIGRSPALFGAEMLASACLRTVVCVLVWQRACSRSVAAAGRSGCSCVLGHVVQEWLMRQHRGVSWEEKL
jgi:hypothetical protein